MPGRYGGNLVVDDPTEAMRLIAAGKAVVLVVPSPPVCVPAGLGAPGHLRRIPRGAGHLGEGHGDGRGGLLGLF